VLEYLVVGASAVQVGTASFTDPRVSQRLIGDLERVLFELKVFNVNEIDRKIITENG